MDPNVEFIDELKPLTENDLYRVQGVPGVAWAVRFYKGQGRLKLDLATSTTRKPATYQQVIVLGLDDATLVGAPRKMVLGIAGRPAPAGRRHHGRDGLPLPLAERAAASPSAGCFEMNDHRAVIVGICKASDTFQTFRSFIRAITRPSSSCRRSASVMSFVLVDAEAGRRSARGLPAHRGADASRRRIDRACKALTRERVHLDDAHAISCGGRASWSTSASRSRWASLSAVAIAGQTFYTFTLENLNQFGSLKAMGVSNLRIVGMVLLQALVVGVLGYGARRGPGGAVRRDRAALQPAGVLHALAGAGRHGGGGGRHRDAVEPGEHPQGAGAGTGGRVSGVIDEHGSADVT